MHSTSSKPTFRPATPARSLFPTSDTAPGATATASRPWAMPARSNPSPPGLAPVPPRLTILEDDFEEWVDEALSRQPVASGVSTSQPLRPARPAYQVGAEPPVQDADQVPRGRAPVATHPHHKPGSRVSISRNVKRLERSAMATAYAGIVPGSNGRPRVATESTARLMRYKAQLDRLDRNALLALPANFGVDHIRHLIESDNTRPDDNELDKTLWEKSVMDCAHNLIFHIVCSAGKRVRNATQLEVLAHLAEIDQLPPDDRRQINSLLAITRTLLASKNLGSTFEVVRRAVACHEEFKKLPVYA